MAVAAQQDLHTLQDGLVALQQQVQALQTELDSLPRNLRVQDTGAQTTTVWLLVCAALVYFMQAGFALVETGTCRVKNTLSILVKNQVDFLCAGLAWFAFGWGIANGNASPSAGLMGTTEYFGEAVLDGAGLSDNTFDFHFQQMFCAVAGTIVSGGIAERADLRGYILYSVIMASFIYPCIACWCWNQEGWLKKLGFVDFAGSSVVHLTGGTGALVGAWVLGPRIGRFRKAGVLKESHEFLPHSVPFIVVGTMILQFGWYGFNAGSTMSMNTRADSRTAGIASVNTTMAAVSGGIVAALISLLRKGRWDVPPVCNGVLAGCVSITAGCACMSPYAAVLVGAVGGASFSLSDTALHRLHIDDPIGAFPVHGVCGFWGTLAVGIFHRRSDSLGEPEKPPELWVQLVGTVAIFAFSGFTSLFVFLVIRRFGMLGSSLREQRRGLDRNMSMEAYNSGEVKNYRAFLSHAKITHGATARWLQLELAHYAGGRSRIFLDSDNLVNLNHLLATVRDKVDVLVVLATEEIWWRPWCAAEIAVASSADVPILLVMMGAVDKPMRLDFGEISENVRHKISSEAMDTLAPFGIGYREIEVAYGRLGTMPQVQFGLLGRTGIRDAIASVACHAGLRRPDQSVLCLSACGHPKMGSPVGAAPPQAEPGRPLTRRWRRRASPNYIIIGDCDDLEAVAAMHICQEALLYASGQDSDFRIVICTDMSEAKVLGLVKAGARIIMVLSKGVLQCPLVQRACLVRAKALWPDGFPDGCSESRAIDASDDGLTNGLTSAPAVTAGGLTAAPAVIINADHLGFEFPGAHFYEELLRSVEASELRISDRASRCLPIPVMGSEPSRQRGNPEPARRDDARAAAVLAAFFRLLFQQIALPMCTHGSWRAIQSQSISVYERAVQMPRVADSTTAQRHSSAVVSSAGLSSFIDWDTPTPAPTPAPTAHRCISESGADTDSDRE